MYQFLIVGHPLVVATFLGLKFLSQLETSQQQSKYPYEVAFEDYIIRRLTFIFPPHARFLPSTNKN
jgi:hypothetical protein